MIHWQWSWQCGNQYLVITVKQQGHEEYGSHHVCLSPLTEKKMVPFCFGLEVQMLRSASSCVRRSASNFKHDVADRFRKEETLCFSLETPWWGGTQQAWKLANSIHSIACLLRSGDCSSIMSGKCSKHSCRLFCCRCFRQTDYKHLAQIARDSRFGPAPDQVHLEQHGPMTSSNSTSRASVKLPLMSLSLAAMWPSSRSEGGLRCISQSTSTNQVLARILAKWMFNSTVKDRQQMPLILQHAKE